ncbi:MAG: MBOAT family O-acyltransferase [Planctomycetota bacterium]|nr:MBOAT family O-acyltransferase [Planctomycetota bacterium]
MIFSEFRFVAFFLAVFCVHWALKTNRARKLWLLFSSYVFYAAWDWRFLSLILFSTLLDYIVGNQLVKTDNKRKRLWLLRASLIGNLGLLGVFKYLNFFVESAVDMADLLGLDVPMYVFDIALPVGISFYTFQTLSYTIDIYRRQLEPAEDILDLAFFVAFFPQLVAGPIVRAKDFLPQCITQRNLAWVDIRGCLVLFLIGFIKKAVIADGVAQFVDEYFASHAEYGVGSSYLAIGLWATQVYCDFSGYTDMAIATAGLLGYNLALNFNFPYFAPSISTFWTRWHISLSFWIRDYVFNSLGGWKGMTPRGLFNILVTWILAGLWHGADWRYVIFGLVMVPGLLLQMQWRMSPWRRRIPIPAVVGNIMTMWWICMALILYRAESMSDAGDILMSYVFFLGPETATRMLGDRLLWLLLGLLAIHWVSYKGWLAGWWRRFGPWGFTTGYAVATSLVLTLVHATAENFVYFQF